MKHLLLLVATIDERDTRLVFFDHEICEKIAGYNGPQFDGAFNPLITFRTTGVVIKVNIAVENYLNFIYLQIKIGNS